jgi:hypothetical protein
MVSACSDPTIVDTVMDYFFSALKPFMAIKDVQAVPTSGKPGNIDCSIFVVTGVAPPGQSVNNNPATERRYHLSPLAKGGYEVKFEK